MRARSERQDDELALVLAVGPELEHAVRELAFGEEGERFVRRFPASAPFARRAALRFEACVPALVRQAAGVEPVPWGRALESVIDRTRESGADWWLTGSAALAVRGLSVQPRDLDLITDSEGGERLAEALCDTLVEPLVDAGGLGRWWARAFLHARVEWVGEVDPAVDEGGPADFGPYAAARCEEVVWRNHELRVPPLEFQLAVSERRGLEQRAALIREALS